MHLKTILIVVVIIAVVLAEVNAGGGGGKQKNGKSDKGKNEKSKSSEEHASNESGGGGGEGGGSGKYNKKNNYKSGKGNNKHNNKEKYAANENEPGKGETDKYASSNEKELKGGKNAKAEKFNEKGKKIQQDKHHQHKQQKQFVNEKNENFNEKTQKNEKKTAKYESKKVKRSVEEQPIETEEDMQVDEVEEVASADVENVCECQQGPPGPVGPQGPPGEKGECVYQPICPDHQDAASPSSCPATNPQVFTTHHLPAIAVHSQTIAPPECPLGLNPLWSGYSLQRIESNGLTIEIDLATPQSCLAHFAIALTTSCGVDGDCLSAQRNDRTYWLMANKTIGTEAILDADADDVISRCTVCDVTKPVLALHSQSATVPKCPDGWDSLWNGYSYMASTLIGSEARSIEGAGSCVREFRKPFAVECSAAKNSCDLSQALVDAWLSIKPQSPANVADIMATVTAAATPSSSTISRCTVCIKVA